MIIALTLAGFFVLASVVAQSACQNMAGHTTDINAVCMTCSTWTPFPNGSACTTRTYNIAVTFNCVKRKNPQWVLINGGGGNLLYVWANYRSATGTCLSGFCIGNPGGWSQPEEYIAKGAIACPVGG